MTRLSKWLARVKMPASLPDMFQPSNPTSMFAFHKPSPSSPKDTTTSPHTLHYVLVLDRSGSMSDRMDEVRHAVNHQIATLRREAEEDNNTCLLTLVRFDTEIEPIVVEQNVRDVQPLTAQDVRPRGMTALVDATVLTIEQAALQIGPILSPHHPHLLLSDARWGRVARARGCHDERLAAKRLALLCGFGGRLQGQ